MLCISYSDQQNPKVFHWEKEEDVGYGDLLLKNGGDIWIYMSPFETVKILRIEFPDLCEEVASVNPPSKRDNSWRLLCDRVYGCFEFLALPADQYQPTQQEEYVMATITTAPSKSTVKATPAPKDPKEAKPAKEAKPRRFGPNDTIHFAADKAGKKYGLDNNPKRVGSASHKLWNVYKEGITVDAYVKAGGNAGAIAWDTDHGFITVKKVI